MILGTIANFAAYEAAMSCIKGVAVKSGSKFIDKAVIPVGAFIIASMIGDKAQDYTEGKVEEVKTMVKAAKNLADAKRNGDLLDDFDDFDFDDGIVENVFDKAEEVKEEEENGESGNA